MKIKTANESLLEYKKLNKNISRLKTKVADRLMLLCKKYPEAPIAKNNNVIIKAGGIAVKSYLDNLKFQTHIEMLLEIEKYMAKGQPKQLKIPFDNQN